jgi:hypothetical protein
MNRTRQSSFLLFCLGKTFNFNWLLLSVLVALSFSASSFAQNDGSQFADESYSEEEAEQSEDKALPPDEPMEEEAEEEVDVWSKESDEPDEDERA